MSEAESRNFINFRIEDNVNDLAGGLLPELAERAGMEVASYGLTVPQLTGMVGILGRNKGLRDNPDIDFLSSGEMYSYARRARETHYADPSAEPEPINRSLDDPQETVPEGTPRLITGAVANWGDFTVDYLVELANSLTSDVTVYAALGQRVMKLPTEIVNENHKDFQAKHDGQYPTEQQYGEIYQQPRLEEAGYQVEILEMDSENGDEIAKLFVARKPELFIPDSRLSMVRTSISALQLLLQIRKAARENEQVAIPKLYMEAKPRPIAQTPEQKAQPLDYQAAQPALRQASLDGKLLLIEQIAA